MSFKEKGYEICKGAVSKELASFCYRYFLLKREAYYYMRSKDYLSPYETIFGFNGDPQAPNAYVSYADVAMETLSSTILPFLSERVNLDLHQQYTFARCYNYGSILHRHKDRPECEISATLNLGGDMWPIYLEDANKKEIKVKLNPGDLLIYRGIELPHWRKPFDGYMCGQVFLHYNNKATKGWDKNLFDNRPHLGYPYNITNYKP